MKKTIRFLFVFILSCISFPFAGAQDLAILEVDSKDRNLTYGTPINIDLNEITHLADSLLFLVEVVYGQEKNIAFQIENGESRKLVWMLDSTNPSEKRVFKLIQKKSTEAKPHISAKIENGGIVLGAPNRPLLRYNFATVYPPEGVKEIYKRSGFIHPLYSPSGKELTRIQPADHYHHYGLWNPWTRVEYKGKIVDFWNLAEGQGTVRFAKFISRIHGQVFGEFKVLHEHVVLEGEQEEVALNEVQGVRIYQEKNNQNAYIADISILMNCATSNEFIIKEYRYAGLGWRATEKWHRENSEIITSEGKNRVEADGSLARWCIVQGEIDEGYAAVLMMSFPTNYNHPEPLRIWPEDQYQRGDVFANFAPTKDRDWKLEPGNNYQLNYRFFVSDQKIDPKEAEKLWQQYANPPKVKVTLVKNLKTE